LAEADQAEGWWLRNMDGWGLRSYKKVDVPVTILLVRVKVDYPQFTFLNQEFCTNPSIGRCGHVDFNVLLYLVLLSKPNIYSLFQRHIYL
jgi:hypothetical protein